jgi:hypothetical protein
MQRCHVAPFDIQRTKLIVENLHFAKVNNTYNLLFFFTNLNNIPYENSWTQIHIETF